MPAHPSTAGGPGGPCSPGARISAPGGGHADLAGATAGAGWAAGLGSRSRVAVLSIVLSLAGVLAGAVMLLAAPVSAAASRPVATVPAGLPGSAGLAGTSGVATSGSTAGTWHCPPGVVGPTPACTFVSASSGAIGTWAPGSAMRLPRAVSAGLGPISTPPWPGTGGGLALALGLPVAAGVLVWRRRPALQPAPSTSRVPLTPVQRWADRDRMWTNRQQAVAAGLAVLFAVAPLAATSVGHLRFSAPVHSGQVPAAAVPTYLAAPLAVASPSAASAAAGTRATAAPLAATPAAATRAAAAPAGPADAPTATLASAPGIGIQPQQISIPALGVRTSVDPEVVAADGALGVPRDPTTVGWWSGGPRPGSAVGTAVLDSHINFDGTPGAFAHLAGLSPGAVLTVTGVGGVAERFVVTGVREYPKSSLPWSSIFSSKVQGRLALVTCGGAFDTSTGHYADNIVAFALPLT